MILRNMNRMMISIKLKKKSIKVKRLQVIKIIIPIMQQGK